jgi:hypothetical protein
VLNVYGIAAASVIHPVIYVNPYSVALEIVPGAAVISSVIVTGEFLTSDVSVVSNNANFTVSPRSLPMANVLAGTQLTVISNGIYVSDSAVITFTSGTAVATLNIYTVVSFSVGVSDVSSAASRAVVYPNPSDGHFNVSVADDTRYEIIDLHGRIIGSGVVNGSKQLYVRNSGIYLLRFIDAGGRSTLQRIVVR